MEQPSDHAEVSPLDSRMDRRATRVAALAVLACLMNAPVSAQAPALPLPATAPLVSPSPKVEDALLEATNAARRANGQPVLVRDEGLARAARAHADEMARLEYFSHSSPDPANDRLQVRLARAGSPLVSVAENLALLAQPGDAQDAAQRAVDGWLASPGHRSNLLRTAYDRVGFGAASARDGRLIVVQDFGAEGLVLRSSALVASSRITTEVRVQLYAAEADEVLVTLGGGQAPSRHLPRGTSDLSFTTDAEATIQLLVGVGLGDGRFAVDDAGWVDPMAGTFRPDPHVPRVHLRIEQVTVRRRTDTGARLTLRYEPPANGELALFVDDAHRPDALTGPGTFELYLPRATGIVTIGIGVAETSGSVRLVHLFNVDTSEPFPTLHAGAAPGSAAP